MRARDLFDSGPPKREEAAPGKETAPNFSITTKAHHSAPVIPLQRNCRRSIYRRKPLTAKLVRLSLEAWRP